MQLPPYTQYPEISDEKITLRQINSLDIPDIIEISFYDGIHAQNLAQAAEMQANIDADYESGNSIHWAIIDKQTNKIVGTCGYYRGLDKGEGELGCILLPKYRGKGYMTAAMSLAIKFGQNTIGLKRIWAATTKQNEKAVKLLEKLNFRKVAEGSDGEIEYELMQNRNL
mgnify:CR=1 FL=1